MGIAVAGHDATMDLLVLGVAGETMDLQFGTVAGRATGILGYPLTCRAASVYDRGRCVDAVASWAAGITDAVNTRDLEVGAAAAVLRTTAWARITLRVMGVDVALSAEPSWVADLDLIAAVVNGADVDTPEGQPTAAECMPTTAAFSGEKTG